MNNKEQEDFNLINQEPIITLLIDGDIIQYLTTTNIISWCKKFGYNHSYNDSRHNIMSDFLNYLHINNKTSKFLLYIFHTFNVKRQADSIIDQNILGNEIKYPKANYLFSHSISNIKYIVKLIRDDLLNNINKELEISNKKLKVNSNVAYIINTNEMNNIINDNYLNDDEYMSNLLKYAKNDLNNGDFDNIVTKSRTMLERTFINILKERNIDFKQKGNYRSLVNNILNMKPHNKWDKRVKKIVSGINKILDSIRDMRNNNSDAHANTHHIKIKKAEAILILNETITIAKYYKAVNERQIKK